MAWYHPHRASVYIAFQPMAHEKISNGWSMCVLHLLHSYGELSVAWLVGQALKPYIFPSPLAFWEQDEQEKRTPIIFSMFSSSSFNPLKHYCSHPRFPLHPF